MGATQVLVRNAICNFISSVSKRGSCFYRRKGFHAGLLLYLPLLLLGASRHEIEPRSALRLKVERPMWWQIPEIRFKWMLMLCLATVRRSPVKVWFIASLLRFTASPWRAQPGQPSSGLRCCLRLPYMMLPSPHPGCSFRLLGGLFFGSFG